MAAFCFNPCFPGSSTSTRTELKTIYGKKLFQSLFSWKLYFNYATPNLYIYVSCSFNPCFPGSSTSTRGPVDCWCVSFLVSILVFLEALLQLVEYVDWRQRQKVSILVFLEALLQLGTRCEQSTVIKVSILVFLEALLQPLVSLMAIDLILCFNPCFPGSSTSTWT